MPLLPKNENNVAVMVWNYHDYDIKDNSSPVLLKLKIYHYESKIVSLPDR
jgi:hypothetical protein